MSKYPVDSDSDETLPQIFDDISEIGAEEYNSLKSAIIAIENAIGLNPNGTAATLVARLTKTLNDDGTFKASALLAAGLIALPITNAMISSAAGIEESKLDLDFATQTLQDQLTSHDIDIKQLQITLTKLLADFISHYSGADLNHDGYQILLDLDFPSSTPNWLSGISATNVSEAIFGLNSQFIDHISANKIAAHTASNISVDSAFSIGASSTVQEALEALEASRAVELIAHRDNQHANGVLNWENDSDGYNLNLQLFPTSYGSAGTVSVLTPTIIDIAINAAVLRISQGDVFLYNDEIYIIDDIGPRGALGPTKPALTSNQLDLAATLPVSSGNIPGQIFGKSSIPNLRVSLASTVFQGDGLIVDSVQVAKPNAAKVVSLGLDPKFIDSSSSLSLEVGVGPGLTRSVIITDLNTDRDGTLASPITIDSIVERINSVLQRGSNNKSIPVSAYRIGSEIAIVHSWSDDRSHSIKVKSDGTANLFLGFDTQGANIVDRTIYPSHSSSFYVNGEELNRFAYMVKGPASVNGEVFTIATNPIVAGIRKGHLLHVKSSTSTADLGTYVITNVGTNSIQVNKPALFTAAANVVIEVMSDAIPLDDYNNSNVDRIFEMFVNSSGRLGLNPRIAYSNTISNTWITSISDNFLPGIGVIKAIASDSNIIWTLGIGSATGKSVSVSNTFSGSFKLSSPSNIDWVEVSVRAPAGVGTYSIRFDEHIDEEELLELGSVKFDGLQRLSNVVDKRLFGSVGLDEVREDFVSAMIETPIDELRTSGVISGFEILDGNQVAGAGYPVNTRAILLNGGIAYVGGVRCVVATQLVYLPVADGTYFIVLSPNGYEVISSSDISLSDLLDGKAGLYIPIMQATYASFNISSAIDLTYKINHLDDKIDFVLDLTNHQVGSFTSIDAAIAYINNYPSLEKFVLRIVSRTDTSLTISGLTKDATLIIDGRIGSLNIASDCRVISRHTITASEPQVSGLIAITAAHVMLENVRADRISIDPPAGSSYSFNGIFLNPSNPINPALSWTTAPDLLKMNGSIIRGKIDQGSAFDQGIGIITESRFIGVDDGTLASFGFEQCSIVNTILDNYAIDFKSDVAYLNISNCVIENFENVAIGSLIKSSANTTISGTRFKNIAKSTDIGSIISLTDPNKYHTVSECEFVDIDITSAIGVGAIVNMYGSVSDCVFDDIAIATTEAVIECQDFSDNILKFISNGIFKVGAQYFESNTGFNAIVPVSFISSTDRKIIANNILIPHVAIGFSISAGSNTSVVNNIFNLDSSASLTGITIQNSSVRNVSISGNIFAEADGFGSGLATGISLGSAGNGVDSKILVDSNTFIGIKPFATNSANIQALTVVDNYFGSQDDGYATFNLSIGANCLFNGNKGSTAIFSGNISNLVYTNNIMGDEYGASFNTISNSTLVGNVGRLIFTNALNDTSIVANRGSLVATSAIVFNNAIIQNNNFDITTDISNIGLTGSSVSDNIFNSTSNVAIKSDAGTNIINANIFNGAVELTGILTKISFCDNVSGNNVVQLLNIKSNLLYSAICDNKDFYIRSDFAINNSAINDNQSSAMGFLFQNGPIANSSISGNVIQSLSISCDAALSTFNNNTLFDYLTLLSGEAGEMSHCNISGNALVGSISIGPTVVKTSGIYTFRNNNVSANVANSIDIYPLGGTANGQSSRFNFNYVQISGNEVRTLNIYEEDTYYYGASSVDKNIISDNKISSELNLYAGLGSAGLNYTNTVISGNIVESGITAYSGFRYNAFSIYNNNIGIVQFNFNSISNATNTNLSMVDNTVGIIRFDINRPTTIVQTNISNNNLGQGSISIEASMDGSILTAFDISLIQTKICGNYVRYISVERATAINPYHRLNVSSLIINGNIFNRSIPLSGSDPYGVPGIYLDAGGNTIPATIKAWKNISIEGNTHIPDAIYAPTAMCFLRDGATDSPVSGTATTRFTTSDFSFQNNKAIAIRFITSAPVNRSSAQADLYRMTIKNINISNNVFEDTNTASILFTDPTLALITANVNIAVQIGSISGNIRNGVVSSGGSVSRASPFFVFQSSDIDIGNILTNLSISNNNAGVFATERIQAAMAFDIGTEATVKNYGIQRCNFTGNSFGNVVLGLTRMTECIFANNSAELLSFNYAPTKLIISSNFFNPSSVVLPGINFDNMVDGADMSGVQMINNYVDGKIRMPPTASWSGSNNGNKICFNHAYAWESPTANFDSTGVSIANVQVLGNTAVVANSATVKLQGSTTHTATTTNLVSSTNTGAIN